MTSPTQNKPRRRGILFPRALGDVMKTATKPLMDKQGKLYGALLRDWPTIIGPERATQTRPQRLQWQSKDASSAILHLDVAASVAPELAYEHEQMIEKCARYFGYRAITRIVIHPSHEIAAQPAKPAAKSVPQNPNDMMDILQRMRERIAGGDKPDAKR